MSAAAENNGAFEELRAALSFFSIDGIEKAFASSAKRALKAHRRELMPAARHEPLTQAERAALLAVGVDPDADEADPSPILDTITTHAALAATAIPLKEAATRLGVDPSRLRQRLGEKSILGVRLADGRSWGIPAFQFTANGELPRLRSVMRAFRSGLRPVQIFAFFTTPQSDLEDQNGEAMTPLDWLLSDGDPGAVCHLAQDI